MTMALHSRLTNRVREFRIKVGWSQIDLARQSGISRAGVSAIEIGRLIPSAAAALALAKALGCQVEDLFQIGGPGEVDPGVEWAWPPLGHPARFWVAELTGRRLKYPVEQTPVGQIPHDGVEGPQRREDLSPFAGKDTLVLACCDPAVGLLAAELTRRASIRLLVLQRSSGDALRLLKQGLVHAAGIHLSGVQDRGGNTKPVRRMIGTEYQLLRITCWEEGVATRPNARPFDTDRAVRSGVRWVGRDKGSGAHQCLVDLFGGKNLPRRVAYDHRSVSALIRDGWADAGICLKLVSEEAGLRFHPLRTEPYDLCFPAASRDDPRIRQLIDVVRSSQYRRLLADLPGYDATDTGNIESVSIRA
jgi:molybdate-binding protein/DNA-binding XRE family transcriptional regulator